MVCFYVKIVKYITEHNVINMQYAEIFKGCVNDNVQMKK